VIFQSLPEPNELNDAHWIFALTHHCVTGSIDNCLKQLWALKEFDAMPPLQRYAGELQSRLGIKFTQMPETVDDLTRPLETKSTIDVFNLPTPSKGASEAQRGDALLLQDLEFSYRANTSFRIGPIDHTFEAGTVSALIGDNGAGKTTLLRMIAGILTLEKGTMSLGKTVLSKSLSISDRARHLNYVFQEPDDQIYLSTVEEELCEYAKNIGVPADLIKSRLNTVTRATGLDLLLAVPPVDLPKPKRRLLTVASAFITSPPVILLDEPTVLLDRKEIKAVQQLIREFQQAQGTVIFISHDLDFVSEMADHILVIDQGKITRKSHRGQEKHLWPEGAEPVFL
jgi:energy-coupling factor transporter ATP-binding protein EcfA2